MDAQNHATRFAELVDGPPRKTFIGNDGKRVQEDGVLVAWVDAPADFRDYLTEHGVDMTFAEYDPETQRWERCLMSEGVADLLEELHAEDGFPFAFEAGPSQGELEWLEAKARGATERAELPLAAYLTPADPVRLEAVTALLTKHRDQASPAK